MISICKTYTFEAAHRLPNHKGKCARPHGHSYKLEVEVYRDSPLVRGDESDSDYGMVMDFADLDDIVEPIIKLLDHRDLNDLSTTFPRTTAELIVMGIVDTLSPDLERAGVNIKRVRLWETAKAYAEWTP